MSCVIGNMEITIPEGVHATYIISGFADIFGYLEHLSNGRTRKISFVATEENSPGDSEMTVEITKEDGSKEKVTRALVRQRVVLAFGKEVDKILALIEEYALSPDVRVSCWHCVGSVAMLQLALQQLQKNLSTFLSDEYVASNGGWLTECAQHSPDDFMLVPINERDDLVKSISVTQDVILATRHDWKCAQPQTPAPAEDGLVA